MGLASSCAGAGVGFATYEALTVAYRQRVGYAPTPSERGAIAGAACTLAIPSDSPGVCHHALYSLCRVWRDTHVSRGKILLCCVHMQQGLYGARSKTVPTTVGCADIRRKIPFVPFSGIVCKCAHV